MKLVVQFRYGLYSVSIWNIEMSKQPWIPWKSSFRYISLYQSIHTKDERKCGAMFVFIFNVNWLWRWARGVTASFGVLFHEIKYNGMTSFMEFMNVSYQTLRTWKYVEDWIGCSLRTHSMTRQIQAQQRGSKKLSHVFRLPANSFRQQPPSHLSICNQSKVHPLEASFDYSTIVYA